MQFSRRARASISANVAMATLLSAQAGAVCTPIEQWRWSGRIQSPAYPHPACTPLVAELTDDNADGRIDSTDDPDVVFTHSNAAYSPSFPGLITVVDGATGTEHFTIPTEVQSSALAIADIDSDGLVEILSVDPASTRLLVFENDGTPKLTGDATDLDDAWEPLAIADLDQDGSPEIFHGNTVLGADGRRRWRGTGGQGKTGFSGWYGTISISHAVDLDPTQPGLELLAGGTLYGATGNSLWSTGADGFTVPADLDGDGDGEVVLIVDPGVMVLDHRGNTVGSTWTAPKNGMSQPLAVDVDADGRAEVLLAHRDGLQLLRWVGTGFQLVWSRPINDASGLNAPSAIDLDGDGLPEILHHDQDDWFILDGRSGAATFTQAFITGTLLETVVAADIDNDCKTELLVNGFWTGSATSNTDAVVAYECAGPVAARSIWNQYNYHQTNVNDDGTIPRVELPPWPSHNSWHTQSTRFCGTLAVHFDAVDARRRDRESVDITWRTVDEVGSIGFTVERAEGSAPFVPIPSWIAATGGGSAYRSVDPQAPRGPLRYRVVEHTAAGRGDESPSVAVDRLGGATGARRRAPLHPPSP